MTEKRDTTEVITELVENEKNPPGVRHFETLPVMRHRETGEAITRCRGEEVRVLPSMREVERNLRELQRAEIMAVNVQDVHDTMRAMVEQAKSGNVAAAKLVLE